MIEEQFLILIIIGLITTLIYFYYYHKSRMNIQKYNQKCKEEITSKMIGEALGKKNNRRTPK